MSGASSEDKIKAHNEGEKWASDDAKLGIVAGFMHEFQRGPSDSCSFSSQERDNDIHEAYEKGVDNVRK